MATIGVVCLAALIAGLVARDTKPNHLRTRRYIVYQNQDGRLETVRDD